MLFNYRFHWTVFCFSNQSSSERFWVPIRPLLIGTSTNQSILPIAVLDILNLSQIARQCIFLYWTMKYCRNIFLLLSSLNGRKKFVYYLLLLPVSVNILPSRSHKCEDHRLRILTCLWPLSVVGKEILRFFPDLRLDFKTYYWNWIMTVRIFISSQTKHNVT